MPRPSFSVVAGTLVVLVGFGAIRRYIAPLIPLPYDAVSPETADYLRAGEVQPLRWRPLSAAVVAEARRRDRPILLVLGSEGSRTARDLDDRAFLDPEITRIVGERFLPARLDLAVSPAWRGVLEPVLRTGEYRDEGLQMVTLTPDGRPILFVSPPALDVRFERDEFAAFLAGTLEMLDRRLPRYPAEIRRDDEAAILRGTRRELPPSDAGLGLRGRTDRASGLVLVPGGARLYPWSLDAIARAGEVLFVRDALRALATSPMNDPLDGGVFVSLTGVPGRTSSEGQRIECTKGLILNAALAETAARVAAASGDPVVDRFARRTADWCFRMLNRGTPAWTVSDQGLDAFSPYYSLTLRRLRSGGLQTDLGTFRTLLAADRDPQALGKIVEPLPAQIADDLARLAKEGPHPLTKNRGIATVEATVLARLLVAARLSGDATRARLLGSRLDSLELGLDRARADLALLLALSDAHFADFLANGRAQGLDLAARDLARALGRYGTSSGTLRAGDGLPGLALSPDAPDLADGMREATAATAVRLADAVGKTLESGPEARRLRRWARACASRYAPLLGTDRNNPNGAVTPESAAFIAACADVSDPIWRVVAGPDPVRGATDELRRRPYGLVVPAIGAAAPSVPRTESGVVLRRDLG